MSKEFLPSYTAIPMEGVFNTDTLLPWEKAPGPQELQALPWPMFRMLHFLLRPLRLTPMALTTAGDSEHKEG